MSTSPAPFVRTDGRSQRPSLEHLRASSPGRARSQHGHSTGTARAQHGTGTPESQQSGPSMAHWGWFFRTMASMLYHGLMSHTWCPIHGRDMFRARRPKSGTPPDSDCKRTNQHHPSTHERKSGGKRENQKPKNKTGCMDGVSRWSPSVMRVHRVIKGAGKGLHNEGKNLHNEKCCPASEDSPLRHVDES